VRLRGWLTISAGLCLGLLTAFQASRLRQLGLREAARDEARDLAAELRWRLDLNRAMLDLNGASMGRALREIGRWPHPLEWAGLYGSGERPLASAGDGSRHGPGEADRRALAAAAPEDLPVVRPLADDRFLAMTRLRIGERDLALAMVLAPPGWRPGADGIWSAISVCLVALAAAALLLVWHGASDILAIRRPPPGR
jgi:hypothetical protein